jgi:hypothetical protein
MGSSLTRQRIIRVHKKRNSFVEAVKLKATNRKVVKNITSTDQKQLVKATIETNNSQGSLKYCQIADLGYLVVST